VQVPLLGITNRFWYNLSRDILKFVTDIVGILSKNGKNPNAFVRKLALHHINT
jgi:hypothetical protein